MRAWLLEMSEEDRKIVGRDIGTVEFGWPVGMPTCRPVEDEPYEVRSSLAGGRIARVLFGFDDDMIVLVHAFVKKTRKTPESDLDLARERLRGQT